MALKTPVLLLGFNRPDKMAQLIRSLAPSAPSVVLLAVDGPRSTHRTDLVLVKETQECVSLIDWTDNVFTRFRSANLGLEAAVTDAVSWATEEYGRVIVIEDDCVASNSLIPFLENGLNFLNDNCNIAHINGYSLVPTKFTSQLPSKVYSTRYIESYAWATWHRSWKHYDSSLSWALSSSYKDLTELLGSRSAALRWKINFHDAANLRINTWAYRWLATIWSHQWKVVAPQHNLVRYDGHQGGTHTLRSPNWIEIPPTNQFEVNRDDFGNIHEQNGINTWIGKSVFKENVVGIADGVMSSLLLSFIKRLR